MRHGTPDTYIPTASGGYVFVEYTTQRDALSAKIESDIDNCLDETRTGVSVDKIEKLIYCHTSQLDTKKLEALREKCQAHNVELQILGVDAISLDLYRTYPGVARDYLGVEIDTGQIVTLEEFLAHYESRAVATSLGTLFHFRDDEMSTALAALEGSDIVIVEGATGVGKTRFGIECCSRFVAIHSDYEIRCVFSRGVSVFEDLRVYFSPPGKYVLFVDDANRINRFEYVLDLLREKIENREIKIVATVRDYAKEKVTKVTDGYGGCVELHLKRFSDEEIRGLILDTHSIKNELYQSRVVKISHGNPRLALMAARVASTHGTLQSINDVSLLYDQYYSSVRNEFQDIATTEVLKSAGIVAFFRAVDRTNERMMSSIEQVFGVGADVFWSAAERLHQMEILDMYETQVVRFSDQVLATYLFYLAFVKRQVLKFSDLLLAYFPDLREKLIDSLNPVLNAFKSREVIEALRPQVQHVWRLFLENRQLADRLQLVEVFWY
ncbi:MAG: hypothetical protein WBH55_14750, partial [Bacteroidota bacterium]